MWKRVWSILDDLLSCLGFGVLVVVGLRWWRGLPVVPADLISAPVAAPQAGPKATKPVTAAPAVAPTMMPVATLKPGQADNSAAPWRQDRGSSGPPLGVSTSPPGAPPAAAAAPTPAYKMAHDWRQEVSVTVNASRYVKSLSDLAPAPASLPAAVRAQLKAAQEKTKGSEMLLVCNVTVEYSGTEEVTLDQAGFQMVSPERQVYPAVSIPFSTGELQPLRATLLANGSARGDLVFAVKRGVQPDEVLYNPS